MKLFPIYNESEEITGAVLTIRNVSSRKKAEMELAEARNLLTNLLTPREKEILKNDGQRFNPQGNCL